MLLLLIASAICALGSPKQQVQSSSSKFQLGPQTGQSLALLDFDREGTTDKALLGGGESRRCVEIFLSGSGTFSLLCFSTRFEAHGPPFTGNLNRNGDTDLSGTDADVAVVWLGNGVGRFERSSAHYYAGRFGSGSEPSVRLMNQLKNPRTPAEAHQIINP